MIKYSHVLVLGSIASASLFSACTPKHSSNSASVATPEEIRVQFEQSESPLVLVHAWATWCGPCREEFPELVKIIKEYKNKGLEVVLVSADDPSEKNEVDAFLKEHDCPVGSVITTELSQQFIETLSPKWAGSLPSSFFYSNGKLLAEWEGKRSHAQYAEKINELLTQ